MWYIGLVVLRRANWVKSGSRVLNYAGSNPVTFTNLKYNHMKLYREHRQLLSDSLETTVEVGSLEEIRSMVQQHWDKTYPNYISNIRIKKECLFDERLPEEWNGICFYVIADFPDYKGQCIGYCNFYEE